MITRIRDVRRAKKLTLQDVADRCEPPTTPQTIGRLETGTRTVSVGWLNRIAKALGVEAADLVTLPERDDIPLAATLDHEGAHAPRRDRRRIAAAASTGDGRDDRPVFFGRLSQRRRDLARTGSRPKPLRARSTATCSFPARRVASSSAD